MSVQKSILDLPAKVIGLIYGELTLHAKLQLAQVHKVLRDAFILYIGGQFHRICVGDLPYEAWAVVLEMCGPGVCDLICNDLKAGDPRVDLIRKYCDNLRYMEVSSSADSGCGPAKELLFQRTGLLSLYLCVPDLGEVLQLLVDLPNIKELSLYMFSAKGLTQIQRLVHLTSLHLTSGSSEILICLFDFCTTLTKLRRLALNYFKIQCDGKGDLPASIKALELLGCEVLTELPYFPRLQSLSIIKTSWSKGNFCKFVSVHSNTLRLLKFCAKRQLQVDEFLKILSSARKLIRLNVVVRKDDIITADFVANFIKIIKDNGVATSSRPLNMRITKCQFNEIYQLFDESPGSEIIRLGWLDFPDIIRD
ncbi:uncharacterized protein LOC119554588 [Drosophila subpulchrella]|uniref:uncharacterized protein LOC119554588 n=1 Tax=Drosophila subpulchrella TaxID=1486046 RepID=UPI0018A1A7E7|nr:uncharacterized protein LOC119554588 [Drosophila subpulchrella]